MAGIDYSDPKYDRFRDMPFSKIYDKDGNDVTRERMLPKILLNCQVCGTDIKVIEEDYEAGVADLRCKPCQRKPKGVRHMTPREKYEYYKQCHRDGHAVFRTRRTGGPAVVTGLSHYAGEEPPEDMKHMYAQAWDGAWLLKGALERELERERELGISPQA